MASAATGLRDREVVALSTVQLSWGGLFDSQPHDGLVHLVRVTRHGTPGALLCGIDRFAKDGPGFSVGGGVSGPNIKQTPCAGCVEVASRDFAGLPISGMREAREPIEEALHGDA